jgi:hypothetical protein
VFAAHLVSMLGSVAAEVALSVLIYERTGSALLSSLTLAVSFLPYALAGGALSSLVDLFPARPLLVSCDVACAMCIAAMLVPGLPIAAILSLLFVVGLISPVFQGARAASLTTLLGPDDFPVGRSLLRSIAMTALLVGMALGSVTLAVVGPTWLLGADAVSFVGSAALLRFGTPATPAAASRPTDGAARGSSSSIAGRVRGVLGDSLAGLRYLMGASPLRWMVLLGWTAAAFAVVAEGLAAAYAVHTGTLATRAGIIATGGAAGTLLGEALVVRLPPRRRRALLVPLVVLTQVPLLGFLASPPVPVAAVLVFVSGLGYAFNQGLDPLVLAATDRDYQGRVLTVQTSGLMAGQGAAAALGGLAAGFLPPNLVVAGAGGLGLVFVLALSAAALRRAPGRGADSAPARGHEESLPADATA